MTEIQNKQCPFCGEYIPINSIKCEFCNEELTQNEEISNIEENTEQETNYNELDEDNETLSQIEGYTNEQKNNKFKTILILLLSIFIGTIGTLLILYKIHSNIDISFNVDKTLKHNVVKKAISSNSNIEKAKKLYAEKDLEKAAALFQEEIDNNNNAVALYYMGEIYKDQNFTKIAIEYYKKANNNKKNFFEPNKRLAQVYYDRGEYAEAQEFGEKALDIKSGDLELLKTMAKIYEMNDEDDKMVAIYNKIIKLEPKNEDANEFLAVYYYRKNDYKTAAVYINNLLNIKYNTDIAYTLVKCYIEIEYYTKAIAVLDEIIKKDSYEYYRASNIKNYVEDLRTGYNISHGRIQIPTSNEYNDY